MTAYKCRHLDFCDDGCQQRVAELEGLLAYLIKPLEKVQREVLCHSSAPTNVRLELTTGSSFVYGVLRAMKAGPFAIAAKLGVDSRSVHIQDSGLVVLEARAKEPTDE